MIVLNYTTIYRLALFCTILVPYCIVLYHGKVRFFATYEIELAKLLMELGLMTFFIFKLKTFELMLTFFSRCDSHYIFVPKVFRITYF